MRWWSTRRWTGTKCGRSSRRTRCPSQSLRRRSGSFGCRRRTATGWSRPRASRGRVPCPRRTNGLKLESVCGTLWANTHKFRLIINLVDDSAKVERIIDTAPTQAWSSRKYALTLSFTKKLTATLKGPFTQFIVTPLYKPPRRPSVRAMSNSAFQGLTYPPAEPKTWIRLRTMSRG